MKRIMFAAAALVLAMALTSCKNEKASSSEAESSAVSVSSFDDYNRAIVDVELAHADLEMQEIEIEKMKYEYLIDCIENGRPDGVVKFYKDKKSFDMLTDTEKWAKFPKVKEAKDKNDAAEKEIRDLRKKYDDLLSKDANKDLAKDIEKVQKKADAVYEEYKKDQESSVSDEYMRYQEPSVSDIAEQYCSSIVNAYLSGNEDKAEDLLDELTDWFKSLDGDDTETAFIVVERYLKKYPWLEDL